MGKLMANEKRDNARPRGGQPKGLQAARRQKVGILYLKGFSVRDIARIIQQDDSLVGADKTSYITIHKDIKAISADLQKHSIDGLEVLKARSLGHLRLIQNRAWTELAGVMITKTAADGKSTYTERVYPSPKEKASLLGVVAACEDKIAKLEGTYAPTEITGKGGKPLMPKSSFNLILPDGGIFSPNGDGNGDKDKAEIPGT